MIGRMNATETLVHRYIQSWNETDPTRRRALIEQVYTADALFTDPLVSAEGWDAIDRAVAGAQQKLGGMAITLAGPIDAHHDAARFTWHAGMPGLSEPVVVGFDVAVAENGRLRAVIGFFDKVPAGV
ncbi:MAG: isomerase [Candidatus Eremiobacteraeota bacterium]|nr:isomerase [Candidatus Eremiobacteraeota bacterium]